MATWECILFGNDAEGDQWKAHLVSRTLRPGILADVKRRGGPLQVDVKRITKGGIDRGGAAFVHRPCVVFDVGSLQLSVACEHVDHYLRRLSCLGERLSWGRRYYKLHSFYNCVVLTPAQYRRLLADMRAAAPQAEAEAMAFYRQRKPINAILADAAVAAGARRPKPEDVGTDPHMRYRRPGGEA